MNWYYASQGSQQGPVSLEDLKGKIARGEVKGSDLVWREGLPDWAPASTVAELQVTPASTTAAPAPVQVAGAVPVEEAAPARPVEAIPSAPYQAPVSPAAGAVPVGYGSVPPKTSGLAIAALICGIVSISLGCCLGGLNLAIALAAIVFGHVSRSQIRKRPAELTGKGAALGGLICGYIGLVISLILVVVGIWMASLSPADIEKLIENYPPEYREQIRQKLREKGIDIPESPDASVEPGAPGRSEEAPTIPAGE